MSNHSFIIEKSSLRGEPVTKRIDVKGNFEYVMQYIAGYIQGCEDNSTDDTAKFKIMHHYIGDLWESEELWENNEMWKE